MQILTDDVKKQLIEAKTALQPQEMCGVIVNDNGLAVFVLMQNKHENKNEFFRLDAKELHAVDTDRQVIAIVHSHPNASAMPSPLDRASMNEHDLPFVIVGMFDDVAIHYPAAFPLLQRPYIHGKQDCFTIVRDFYKRELAIDINDYARSEYWWQEKDIESPYLKYLEDEGFFVVENGKANLQYGDVLLCRLGHTYAVNHAMIYLGSKTDFKSETSSAFIADRAVLHHDHGELSRRAVLGVSRLDTCELVVRHKTLGKTA